MDGLVSHKGLDLVAIATPSHLHAPNAIAALRAGADVLVEKPLALKLADVDAMYDTAGKTGRGVFAFHNFRYSEVCRKLLEIVSSGVLGRLLTVRMAFHGFSRRWDWQTLRAMGGGCLGNTGPHVIDMALQLFGPSKPEVFCAADQVWGIGDAEDHVKVVFKGRGAPIVDFEITSACAYPQEFILIMGTKGGLHGTTGQLTWKTADPSALPQRSVETGAPAGRKYYNDTVAWQPEQTWKATGEDPWTSGYYHRLLYAHLREGAPPPVTPTDARRVVEVLDECLRQMSF